MILFGNQQNRSKIVTYGNGLLYNWYAVSQANFAPAGWHVPTEAEFNTLITTLGGASVAGGKMKSTRTSAPYFASPNTGATDESKFRAFGNGRRIGGSFASINNLGVILSITLTGGNVPYYMLLSKDNDDAVIASSLLKSSGVGIRLLKDTTTWSPSEVVTDIDGNLYATVQIGTQIWLKSNWKCTKYNDGTPIPFAGSNGVNFTNLEWGALTTPGLCSYNNAAIIEYTEKFPL